MVKRKVWFKICIVILIICVGVLTCCYINQKDILVKNNPKKIVKKTLDIQIPTSAEIVDYEYIEDGHSYDVIFKLNKKDFNIMRKDIVKQFGKECDLKSKKSLVDENYIENLCNNYNVDKDKIIELYTKFGDGYTHMFRSEPKTRYVSVIISECSDDFYQIVITY